MFPPENGSDHPTDDVSLPEPIWHAFGDDPSRRDAIRAGLNIAHFRAPGRVASIDVYANGIRITGHCGCFRYVYFDVDIGLRPRADLGLGPRVSQQLGPIDGCAPEIVAPREAWDWTRRCRS